jgi:hypothetical protein
MNLSKLGIDNMVLLYVFIGIILGQLFVYLYSLKSKKIDPREKDPLDYYKNKASYQKNISHLYTLAYCKDGSAEPLYYMTEVFTESDSSQKLAEMLNKDLLENGNSKNYWKVLRYKAPEFVTDKNGDK